jgi:hypothetical protein
LCASALQKLGCEITFIGNIGRPISAVFKKFAYECVNCYETDIANSTDALEFDDGKIMLTDSSPLRLLTYESLLRALPKGIKIKELMANQNAIILTNWTMMPKGTHIYRMLLLEVFPFVQGETPVLFDIADPSRRTDAEIIELLEIFSEVSMRRTVFLSANETELERFSKLNGRACQSQNRKIMLEHLHKNWPLEWILHSRSGAESFGMNGYCAANGFFTEKPRTSTGGGDHFNGGFIYGIMYGLRRELALLLGNATSGSYVRIGKSPSINDIKTILES